MNHLLILYPRPPVAAGVVTGEATGDGIVRDAGETSKEPDDHLGDAGGYLLTKARRLAALYLKPRGSSAVVSSTRTACYCCSGAASSPSEPGPSSFDSSLPKPAPSASDSPSSVSVSNIGSEKDDSDKDAASVTLAKMPGDRMG
ncbi:hypothetical protein Tco_0784346 [Tanacetum coccineum]